MKISRDDISPTKENALELFYSGIRSEETRRTMDGGLRRFLLDACDDILQGSYEERAQEFVDIAKADQDQTVKIILVYVDNLKERTRLPKGHDNYLNPSSIPNQIKPIRKLLDMSGLGLGWTRIHSTYPEIDNIHRGRGYARDEIRMLLEHSESLVTDFIILAASSGGLRIGVWEGLTWDCVFPIYKTQDGFSVESSDDAEIVCAGMAIYKGTPSEYAALISKEAWDKLRTYRKQQIRDTGKTPRGSDPLLLSKFDGNTPLSANAARNRIEKLVVRSGLRTTLQDGKRRHEVPATHGFRRYWDKVMMDASRTSDTLSALVKKERLLGHDGIVKTDKNYYWTNILDLVQGYLAAMPELTISDEYRLQYRLKVEREKSDRLEKTMEEKDAAISRLAELEAKVRRMERYQISR